MGTLEAMIDSTFKDGVWFMLPRLLDAKNGELVKAMREVKAGVEACGECRADTSKWPSPIKVDLVGLVDSQVGGEMVDNMVRGVMRAAGVDPTRVLWLNVEQVCVEHLYDALDSVASPWVMSFGAKAAKVVRTNMSLESKDPRGGIAERWLIWGRRWVMVCLHPNTAIQVPSKKKHVLASLNTCADHVAEALGVEYGGVGGWAVNKLTYGHRCEKCGSTMLKWADPNGIWWCSTHANLGRRSWIEHLDAVRVAAGIQDETGTLRLEGM
jgi:hypothetical protein